MEETAAMELGYVVVPAAADVADSSSAVDCLRQGWTGHTLDSVLAREQPKAPGKSSSKKGKKGEKGTATVVLFGGQRATGDRSSDLAVVHIKALQGDR